MASRSSYDSVISEYDGAAKRLQEDLKSLDAKASSKVVELTEYKKKLNLTHTHYSTLIDIVEQLKDKHAKEKDENKKEKLEKEIKYVLQDFKDIIARYGKTLERVEKRGVKLGLTELKREEAKVEDLEAKLGQAAAIFLLVSASGSFGYALANTISNANNITGATIGILGATGGASLLLSTITLILVVLLVSPSDAGKGLFKKKNNISEFI